MIVPRLRVLTADRIDTDRLVLRAPLPEDAPRITELLNSWEVVRWLVRVPYPYRRGHADAWIKRSNEERVVQVGWPYLITLRDHGTVIGSMDMSLESEHLVGSLGYWVGEDYWQGGYATEAAKGIIEFAFNVLRLDGVSASVLPDNERSMQVLRKAGMAHLDRRMEETLERGQVETEYFYLGNGTWKGLK